MDINCIGDATGNDTFRKYLEATGTSEKLTEALVKLYEAENRPEDVLGFISRHMNDNMPDFEMVKELKLLLKKLKDLLEKLAMEKRISEADVRKSKEELDALLKAMFEAFVADTTGKSMLKEFFTEELFPYIKNKKTKLKAHLLDSVQSGLTHYDSIIGLYASDQFAYEVYYELFDCLLEELHETEVESGEGESYTFLSTSQPAVDWGDPEELGDCDPTGKFIKEISITVGRAMNEVSFAPTISYNTLEDTTEEICTVLSEITDEDFKGEFHELFDIEEDQKNQWIKEGILFPPPENKYLEAAATYRLWPIRRGVFLNDKKNFRIWLNEEEHMQITTFDKGGNMHDVYDRMVRAMGLLTNLNFAKHDRWGYLAHNVENIGTGMRIVVKAKLPQMSKPENAENFGLVLEGNKLKVLKDLGMGRFLITNVKKMGVTEISIAKGFEAGIREIITLEKCAYK